MDCTRTGHNGQQIAEQIATFTTALFEPDDLLELRLLPGRKQTWHKSAALAATAARLAGCDQNVYMSANPRSRNGGTNADVLLARCVFVDFDHTTPAAADQRIQEAGLPAPTLILNSGHGVHAYWRLSEPMADFTEWTKCQKRLIAAVNSDPQIHDPARIMRVPGFLNVKSEPHVMCEILECHPSRRYALADLLAVLPVPAVVLPAASANAGNSGMAALSRATAYAAKVPPATEGARNATAFRLAAAMTRDFALPDNDALSIISRWNAGNAPPLDDKELRDAIKNARKYGTHADGVKLVEPTRSAAVAVDAEPWPDPMAPEAYHGVLGDLVRVISPHTEADSVSLLATLLAGFGSLIGRTAHFRAEGDQHYGNLFACLVGNTSKGRKGTSWGRARQALTEVDPDWATGRVLGGLSSGEGLIWAVRDPIHKAKETKGKGVEIVCVDEGIADKRLLVLESEFGSVLKVILRERNTLSAIMRQAWDRGDLATLTKNSPAKATGAHISILGHITAQELRRLITENDLANGLANRFVWLCCKRSKCLPEGGALNPSDLAPQVTRLQAAATFATTLTEPIRRDEEARKIWHAVYPSLSAGKPGLLGAATSRAEAQVMRLAMLYAVLDCSPLIRPEHLHAALAVWDYAEQSARYIFGASLGDPTADATLSALRAHPGGMYRNDIREHFGRNKSADEIGLALRALEEAGLAKCTKEPDTGGRPAEKWVAVGTP